MIKQIDVTQQLADVLDHIVFCGPQPENGHWAKQNKEDVKKLVACGMIVRTVLSDSDFYTATPYGRAGLCDFYEAADCRGVLNSQNKARAAKLVGRGQTNPVILGTHANLSEKQRINIARSIEGVGSLDLDNETLPVVQTARTTAFYAMKAHVEKICETADPEDRKVADSLIAILEFADIRALLKNNRIEGFTLKMAKELIDRRNHPEKYKDDVNPLEFGVVAKTSEEQTNGN